MTLAILVVAYNSSETIIQTLDSIKNQTYRNLELVIVDDASKDDTAKIVKRWIKENEKRFVECTLVENLNNVGVTSNCNRAVMACKSDYYKLIAADDYMEVDAVYEFAKYLDRNDGIAISKINIFSDNVQNERVIEIAKKREEIEALFKNGLQGKELLKEMLRSNIIPAAGVGFIKKELYLQMGGYDEEIPMMEDYPFWLRYVEMGKGFVFVDKILVNYRINERSIGNSKDLHKNYCESQKIFFDKVKKRILKKEKMYYQLLKDEMHLFFLTLRKGN